MNHTTNPQTADNYRSRFDVAEALEAAGWIADDENPLEILRKGPTVWAITNDCGDSQLGADGWDVDFPSDVPNAVVLAACHAAVSSSAVVSADQATLLREVADRLWALANRTTERGAGVLWAAEWLRRVAAEEQPAETQDGEEAHPPHHSWLVEWCANGGDWAVAYPTHDYGRALDRLARGPRDAPTWRWRLVRETTSYTVEDPERPTVGEQPDTQTREADRG